MKSKLVTRKKTIAAIVHKSNVNEILEELDNTEIDDIAVIFRSKDGQISSRWIGDALALITMTDILNEDIRRELCQSE